MTRLEREASAAVVEAARRIVRLRRWAIELPAERPLPDALEAALERAVAALDAAAAGG